jgi:hypothetical protein
VFAILNCAICNTVKTPKSTNPSSGCGSVSLRDVLAKSPLAQRAGREQVSEEGDNFRDGPD